MESTLSFFTMKCAQIHVPCFAFCGLIIHTSDLVWQERLVIHISESKSESALLAMYAHVHTMNLSLADGVSLVTHTVRKKRKQQRDITKIQIIHNSKYTEYRWMALIYLIYKYMIIYINNSDIQLGELIVIDFYYTVHVIKFTDCVFK